MLHWRPHRLLFSRRHSENARDPVEQIPLLNATVKPFTTKRMLAGQLEGFSLQVRVLSTQARQNRLG
jgi:hypothetical protein